MAVASWMDSPPTVTASASGRNRLPRQAGQGQAVIKDSISFLLASDWVST